MKKQKYVKSIVSFLLCDRGLFAVFQMASFYEITTNTMQKKRKRLHNYEIRNKMKVISYAMR